VLLSAALIVKNEERFLEGCLSSIQGLVDEIVIVDTGSTDATPEIARKFGARVFNFPWQSDFSAARNFGLEQLRGDWVLYIDADERLRPGHHEAARALLGDSQCIGAHVLLHPRPGVTPYWVLRFFRNHPLIRFSGIIHENMWPGVLEYRAAHGGYIGHTKLEFDHEGYTGDQNWKHERNLPLLLRELERTPDRLYCWCHLADIYLALGRDDDAVQAWKKGVEIVRAKPKVLPDDILPYLGLIQFEMSKNRDAMPWIEETGRRFPHNLQLIWLRARALMLAEKFDQAISLFNWLIARGEAGDYERAVAYDEKLLNAWPYEGLATCHFRLGHYAESRRAYSRAAAFDPTRMDYRVKQALCAKLERQPGEPAVP
jgi:glycosyltransferase involved in cell wall biosynthesis